MTAYKDADNWKRDLYMTLSMVLAKNKCEVVNINLESGILDIHGETDESVWLCENDIQRVFADYLYG